MGIKEDRAKDLARLDELKRQRNELREPLSEFLGLYDEARIEYEKAHQRLMKVKTKFDNLDRRIANIEKYKVIPNGKSGIKKNTTPAKPVDPMSAVKAMSPEQKAEFIASIMKL